MGRRVSRENGDGERGEFVEKKGNTNEYGGFVRILDALIRGES